MPGEEAVSKHPTSCPRGQACPRRENLTILCVGKEIAAALLHADVNVRYVSELRSFNTDVAGYCKGP